MTTSKNSTFIKEAETQYKSIYANCLVGTFKTTPCGKYITVNQALAELYGYSSDLELLKSLTDIQDQLYVNPQRREEFISLLKETNLIIGFESQIYRQDGSIIWISENVKAIRDEKDLILYYEGTVKDITKIVEERDKLYYRTYYDPLTELPNTAFLIEQLTSLVSLTSNFESFTLMLLELDRFKLIRNSLNPSFGDQILKDISRLLKKVVQPTDCLVRVEGDKFAILLKNTNSLKEVIKTVEKIQTLFNEPWNIQNYCIFTNPSIGIFYSPFLYHNPSEFLPVGVQDVLNNTEIALQQAKNGSKGSYCIFKPNMYKSALIQFKLETDLHKAISRSEFELHYQPIIDLFSQKLKGFEALLRWNHPRQGVIYPGDFITVAEDAGFIIALGNWIFQEATAQLNKWQQKTQSNLFMSINLSVKQFANPQLVNDIQSILEDEQIDPKFIHLEITESSCIYDEYSALTKLIELKEKGFKISIDDFGTGHTSFNYLYQLPIDIIKIDRSFISEIASQSAKSKIAVSILKLANELRLETIAEGIETIAQLEKVKLAKCRFGQGYLFSKPLNVQKATELILNSFFIV